MSGTNARNTRLRGPAPAALETGKVLTVFIRGDVIVEDRDLLLGVAPRGPHRFVGALWEREEYFGALSAGLAQSQPPPHQG